MSQAVLSMTGYGAASAPCLGGRLSVELRAVNHKFCDVKIRAPREFGPLEPRILAEVRGRISRGHVELSVRWDEPPPGRAEVHVDLALARSYVEAYARLRGELGVPGEIDLHLLAAHEVVAATEVPTAPEALWQGLAEALERALDGLVAMREAEGRNLRAEIEARCGRLEELRRHAAAIAPQSAADARARLRERIAELTGGVALDPGRLEQEVALLAERTDVAEELERIESHVAQVRETLAAGGAIGRKLDFLCQELFREINTVGSKSQSVGLTRTVLDFKLELEKMREQVQNVE